MFLLDSELRKILRACRTIALIGYSDKPHRDSHKIGRYLREAGYRVWPVNPTLSSVDGQTAYPSLRALPEPVDMVNVFRRSEFLPEIVEDTIAINTKVLWIQLGIEHSAAEERAVQAGLTVVARKCIYVEHERLLKA